MANKSRVVEAEVLENPSVVNIDIENEVPETPALNVILKLKGDERKGEFNFHCEDLVLDPVSKKLRKARLLKNVGTIWQDEQKEVEAKWAEKNIRTLKFSNGNAIIQIADSTAIEFINVCGANLSNPNHGSDKKVYFEVWNPLEKAIEEEKLELLQLSALQSAATALFEPMKKHSVYLGISLANQMGQLKKERELRVDYMKKAKADPKKFMESLVDPSVDIAWAIKLAIVNGTIDLEKPAGQARWASGGFIADIPTGTDGEAFLIKFAIGSSDEGKAFAAQVKEVAK